MCWKDASASAARIFEEQKQDLNTYLSWQLPKGAEGQLKPRKHSIILALSGTNLSYFVHQLTRIISWQKNNRFTAKPKLQLLTHRLAVKANLQEKIWNTLAKSNNFHEREQILTLLEQPSVILPFTNNEQKEKMRYPQFHAVMYMLSSEPRETLSWSQQVFTKTKTTLLPDVHQFRSSFFKRQRTYLAFFSIFLFGLKYNT